VVKEEKVETMKEEERATDWLGEVESESYRAYLAGQKAETKTDPSDRNYWVGYWQGRRHGLDRAKRLYLRPSSNGRDEGLDAVGGAVDEEETLKS
jgi:hypothetical protein